MSCMRWISFKIILTSFIFTGLCGCTSTLRPVKVPLDVLSPSQLVDSDFKKSRDLLDQYLKKNPSDRELLADVESMLDAINAEAKGDSAAASAAWLRAVSTARGGFGERAFSGWLRAFAKSRFTSGKLDRREIARMILSETRGGSLGPWMLSRSLQTEDKILPILLKEIPEFLNGVTPDATLDPPETEGVPPDDPVLTALAEEYCRYKGHVSPSWQTWKKTLLTDVAKYFDALAEQCSGQPAKALAVLSEVAPRLASQSSLMPLALESYSRMIRMRRDQGERDSVAPLYMPYMQLWKNPAINESTLALSRVAFEQRRIEETLWAARARANIGDGDSARTFADDVLTYVNSALLQSFTLSADQKSNLVAAAAETYHILAFRLAVEARDWEKSFNIAELALRQAGLPDEWSTRFRWSQGLYRFLGGEFDQARRIWEQLLTDTTDEKIRPQVLFWLVRAHEKLGNASESSFYAKTLSEDYPLNFYSVVALSKVGSQQAKAWETSFEDVNELVETLSDWQRIDIDDLREDRERGRLLRRAEVLASLKTPQLSTLAIEELQRSIEPATGGGFKNIKWAIYISRLHGSVGNWLGSISLTTKMMKTADFWRDWPEQILTYFPRPYLSTYETVGKELGIDYNELLAISRQESSFKADAKSGANAYGMMQLMPYTAKRLLKNAQLPDKEKLSIPQDLMKPELNIRLAADYVRELHARFRNDKAQSYAAYNAGVQTVDSWLARRMFDDPLVFIELIPYQETRDYVKGVLRNQRVYEYLSR